MDSRWPCDQSPRCVRTLPVALLAAASLTGCTSPRFEGPQVQDPPVNFIFDANASQGRNVFPDRQQIAQVAWFHAMGDRDHSSVFITTYANPSSRADVQAARNAQEQRYGNYIRYGDLESLWIDEHPAWGWLETQVFEGGVVSLEYKMVVSYDSVSYAVEYFSNEPEYMDAAQLRDVVMTFAVGKRELNVTAILILAVVVLVTVLAWLRLKT
jgi:hypothetical protein